MEARAVLRGVRAPESELLGDEAVCIAVLDGPVDMAHPCFAGADLTRIDTLVREPAGAGPMSLHGTHVASLLFGQPGSPVTGIAPRCRGLLLPVFTDRGGSWVPQLDLARALERAVQEGAHIVNISGGELSRSAQPDAQPDAMLERALRLCEDNGVLVVAAVGNDGCDCQQVPASVPRVLAVGAAGPDGEPLEMSNWGSAYATHGVLAPGQGIEGAAPGGGRAALTGSSFATPLVSGVAALLVGAQVRLGLPADPRAAGRAVLDSATASPCSPDDSPECRRHLVGTLTVPRAFELITKRGSTAVTNQDAAPVPTPSPTSPPSDWPIPHQAETRSPAPGMIAAGELPSTGTSHSEPNERVSAMDTTSRVYDPAPEDGAAAVEAAPPETVPADGWQEGGVRASADCRCGGRASEADGNAAGEAPPRQAEPAPAAMRAAASHGGVQEQAAAERGVRPACGCGGANGVRPLVFAVGTIGFDFRTEARRDSFRQLMSSVPGKPEGGIDTESQPSPYNPNQLAAYLAQNPWASDKLTWTLEMDRTPVYALEAEVAVGMELGAQVIDPGLTQEELRDAVRDPDQLAKMLMGLTYPPVSTIYRTFRDAIVGQALALDDPALVSRVSIPGVLTDRTVRLFSGPIVPVVEVKSRGLYTWNENALVKGVVEAVNHSTGVSKVAHTDENLELTIRTLLDKIYWQFRNLGQSSADRALNYAGTNAFLFGKIADGVLSALYVPGKSDQPRNLYALDRVTVSKSPYCRPGSDCQDVIISFFDPEDVLRSKVNYMFTIDVSDEFPVSLAPIRKFLGDM